MSTYTLEQVRDKLRAEETAAAPLVFRHEYKAMADVIDAILRERESAKAAVTDEIFEAFDAAQTKAMGEYEMQQYHAGKESHLVNALDFATRVALEAVAPMLASARVAVEMPAEFGEWFGKNYPGPDTIIGNPHWHAPRIWRAARRALLAAAPKSEKEE